MKILNNQSFSTNKQSFSTNKYNFSSNKQSFSSNKMVKFTGILLVILMQFVFIPVPKAYAYSNPATVPLLSVANFASLANTLTSSPTGPTVLNNGDLGVSSAGTCTGFPGPNCTASGNGTLNGGSIQYRNTAATTGQTDATAAVTNIGLRTADQTITSDLTGLTLPQGVYAVGAAAYNLNGDLTLNGDANSVFIFKMTDTLITTNTARVLLTGGAQACNVFWKVPAQATFDGATTMVGTVFAGTSVDFTAGGATLAGRVIAQTAAITFRNTTVNNSSCAAASTSSSSSVTSTTSTTVGPDLNKYIAPSIIESKRIDADSIFVSWGPYSGTDTFIVQYGLENGQWLYSTNVTGFSTTINDLPANLPIWVRIAVRDNITVGKYGEAKLVGGPSLPNTGFAPHNNNIPWYIPTGILVLVSSALVVVLRKRTI